MSDYDNTCRFNWLYGWAKQCSIEPLDSIECRPLLSPGNLILRRLYMRRLRFLLALVALGLAGTVKPAQAFDASCPSIISYPLPWGGCGYTGHGTCARETCEYTCNNGTFTIPDACTGTGET